MNYSIKLWDIQTDCIKNRILITTYLTPEMEKITKKHSKEVIKQGKKTQHQNM